jgi:putative Mg2+ transporter-C (MgtC) family protein
VLAPEGELDLSHFVFNILASLVMGVAIGVERQYRQHSAGLRTNALVCVGAALFVSLSRLIAPRAARPGSPHRSSAALASWGAE